MNLGWFRKASKKVADIPAAVKRGGPGLRADDLCGQCPARAYVLLELPSGPRVQFCGHHFVQEQWSLMAQGAVLLVDDRHLLTQRVSQGNGFA